MNKVWNKAGIEVEECSTSEEVMKAAKLDYNVSKQPLCFNWYNDRIYIENTYALVREDTGTPLTKGKAVSNVYTVIQNKEAFEVFDEIAGLGQMKYETAGCLKGGGLMFVSAKLPGNLVVRGNDSIDKYLLFTQRHDGSGSILILFTPIRVVCQNTLNYAVQKGSKATGKISIRHTISAKTRLNQAKNALGIMDIVSESTLESYKKLDSTPMTQDEAMLFLINFHMTPTEKKDLEDRYGKLDKVAFWSYKPIASDTISTRKANIVNEIKYNFIKEDKSSWGLYNAFTYYKQHYKNYSSPEASMMTNIYGTNYNDSEKFMNKLLKQQL